MGQESSDVLSRKATTPPQGAVGAHVGGPPPTRARPARPQAWPPHVGHDPRGGGRARSSPAAAAGEG
eukprot:9478478-Pyramimonas_sp.AAC.1